MFAAIFTRAGEKPPQALASGDTLLAALQPVRPADKTGVWQGARALIAQALWANTPEAAHEAVPQVCPQTGRVIAAWVRLDNRAELCAHLRLDPQPDLTDPQIILAAHRAWGADCADRLEGDFSFVIYDPDQHQVFCARDSAGVMPLTYYLDQGLFVAATSVPLMAQVLGHRISHSPHWAARYLAMCEADPVATPYAGLSHLPRAHHLTVSTSGAPAPKQYFTFDGITSEPGAKPQPHWVDAYAEAFDRAVKRRLRSAHPIGAELSGGLDSGGIMAFAVRHLAGQLDRTPAYGTAYHAIDGAALEQTAAHLGLTNLHVLRAPQVALEFPSPPQPVTLGTQPRPDTHGHYEAMYAHAQSAGVRTLLSGYGGDEVVTALGGFNAHSEALWQGDLMRLYRSVPGRGAKRLARAGLYWWRHHFGRPAPLPRFGGMPHSLLSDDVAADLGVSQIFTAEADRLSAARTFNERLLATRRFRKQLSGRLEQTAYFANHAGIEFRFPMLDRQLMIQVLQTPTIDRYAYGRQRFLHRRAVEPRLPPIMSTIKKNRMGDRIAPWPWETWFDLGPKPPSLSAGTRDLIDPNRLAAFERQFSLSPLEFNAQDYDTKAFTFINWHLLKNLDYWHYGG